MIVFAAGVLVWVSTTISVIVDAAGVKISVLLSVSVVVEQYPGGAAAAAVVFVIVFAAGVNVSVRTWVTAKLSISFYHSRLQNQHHTCSHRVNVACGDCSVSLSGCR